MALKQETILDSGVQIEYIKIRDCQLVLDIYKDQTARNEGKAPVLSRRVSLNDSFGGPVYDVNDDITISKIAENIASAIYSELKIKHYQNALDC
jgi:hypothetical protein